LSIKIRGLQRIIIVLYANDQLYHDIIIGNNFQRLYSQCTQTKNQIIFRLNGHLVTFDKLNAYYHKTEFTHSQHGDKAIHPLLELSIRGQIIEQKEELCKELYYDNPFKLWNKDKTLQRLLC